MRLVQPLKSVRLVQPLKKEAEKMTIDEMKAIIEEQSAILERIGLAPKAFSTIVGVRGDRIILTGPQGYLDVARGDYDLAVGETVLVEPQSYAVLDKAMPIENGNITHISRIVDDARVVIIGPTGEGRLVLKGAHLTLQENDLVRLDSSNSIIIELLPKPPGIEVERLDEVTWDDIGGQEEAKAALIEAIDIPYRYSTLYAHYGRRPTKGVLLYGPPGNGKTMLAKAAASAAGGSSFFPVKGPEILNKYVGESERTVRELFARARSVKDGRGVIFIDEAEAILGRRGDLYSQMEKVVVPTFLTEMDGLESNKVFVILATNRPDLLDEAVVRPGRIDRSVEVAPPTQPVVEAIMRAALRKVPHKLKDDHFNELSVKLSVVADKLSGAAVVEVLERAKSNAIVRDIKSGCPGAITREDIRRAIEATY